ncbi:hypothetical protein IEQ34_015630 [Dendrobium chrysotoxum]|uniref:NAC domain-containing protein n=1 Tax=Dendrobium chrysotoxum TaxID=161865 RepID=A0AAV7GJG5_DENCH|nr:hypothetical protein IEQ34_015630 [Dendrobium chrysotoxum]
MEEKHDMDKEEEIMLPGFRFHPTDEELVEFYLRRKIQQKPLSVELIRQLDIYKYDPWDLPKLAATGEKQWYFYCPRDRKYRNSSRPNRVTRAGFWKATGTDRLIYSSEGIKCIGLKKSLVFYKGRAAKGIKTDWMMHEFRLPSPNVPIPLDKNILTNDSWAICRIFKKKINIAANRAASQSWASPLTESADSEFSVVNAMNSSHFTSENIICTINSLEKQRRDESHSPLDVYDFKSFNLINNKSEMPTSSVFSSLETLIPSCCSIDFGQQQPYNGYAVNYPLEMRGNLGTEEEDMMVKKSLNNILLDNNQWGNVRNTSFPFNLPLNISDE